MDRGPAPPAEASGGSTVPSDRATRDPRGVARWTLRLLWASVGISAVAVPMGLALWMQAGGLAELSGSAFDEAAEAYDGLATLFALLGLADLAIFAVLVVAFLAWFRRAYHNLAAAGLSDLRYRPGWAVGGWFVPFLNLVRPKQVMDDIWRGTGELVDRVASSGTPAWRGGAGSDPSRAEPLAVGWRDRRVPGRIHVWWASFLAAGALGQVSFRLVVAEAETFEVLIRNERGSLAAGIASDALYVVAGLLLIGAVRTVTQRQARVVAASGRWAAGGESP